MKVLLTGATGLLGSHLTELMLHKNIQIYALVRKVPSKSFIGSLKENYPLNLTLIESDLDDYVPNDDDYFDAVIHTAAKLSSDEAQKDEIWQTNFEATKNLINKLQGKFTKWIQVSSIGTLSNGHDILVDESFHGNARETHYAQSKLKADQWLMENYPDSLIIHPTYMLGKWDSKPSSGAIFFALKYKKMNTFLNHNKNFVGASDVALGILKAIEADQRGHFILGNINISIKDFLMKASNELNIPFNLCEESLSDETLDFVKEFCLSSSASSLKAMETFGYNPEKDLNLLIKEVLNYFEENKMLKRSKQHQ